MSFNLTKMLKKLKGSNLVLVAAAVALFIAILNYSKGKDTYLDGLENDDASETHQSASAPSAPTVDNPQVQAGCCANSGGSPQPSQPLGQNEVYGSANGIHTSVQGLPPACSREQVVDPKELLPRDNNNAWSKLNPQGTGGLDNGQFLQAGYHVGIDTVGQSLRNANLQLRSEPANPQLNVGPWNNTTIGPDFNRRPLEIGCGVSN